MRSPLPLRLVRAAVIGATTVTAASLAGGQSRPAPQEKWQIYAQVRGEPTMDTPELHFGDSTHIVIASNIIIMGSHSARPLSGRPPTVLWSIEPSNAGVTIGSDGRVSVSPRATPGTYTVHAQATSESRTLKLTVYDAAKATLVGTWTEAAQIVCANGQEVKPEAPLRELIFTATEHFSATWFPFETRQDYWGTYRYEPETRSLTLTVDTSLFNYMPKDIVPHGLARIDSAGRLVLRGIWLGDAPRPVAKAPSKRCGHVFVR